ncbi:MAG TPA: GntR family transcriptional regulator [Flavisolibacter sp.]|jgi:DNA-binding transcriptional regulator YhcF (GntR family)|nr:GntR family transcriptional regulator [Flavisolibacter sp.]
MTLSLEIGLDNNCMPKYLQVANAVTDAIRRGELKKGQKILSINELSEEYLVSRVTVEKAYTLLREQGTIIPIKGKGYYINNVNVKAPIRVLLLFNKLSEYKKQIYQGFIERIGPDAIVDLKIHHFDVEILRTLIDNNQSDYNYFVIMPHFYDNQADAINIIRSIPVEKLVLLDKKIPDVDLKCAAVYQDFENDIITALEEGLPLLKKYKNFYMVRSGIIPYPPEMEKGFRRFCMQNFFKSLLLDSIAPDADVKKGDAYIVKEEIDLANLIKICKAKNFVIGKDVGIISYNETPLKEVLLDGITVISTDHSRMGETAADLILRNSRDNVKNPFSFIRRKSL